MAPRWSDLFTLNNLAGAYSPRASMQRLRVCLIRSEFLTSPEVRFHIYFAVRVSVSTDYREASNSSMAAKIGEKGQRIGASTRDSETARARERLMIDGRFHGRGITAYVLLLML
jgi:hypothetical protein